MTRWKPSSRSIGAMLRANGAKAQPANIVSWYLPTRSPQLCQENTSTQLSFRLNISSSASPLVAEMRDQQVGHLPAVARLLAHVAHEAVAVVLARRAVE